MKKYFVFPVFLFLFGSCKQNAATGELEPSWVFWVLLGLIALGLIFGVVMNSVRSRKNDDEPTKTEKEIKDYEETLRKKEEEEEK